MANIQFNNIKEINLPFGAMPIGIDGLTEDLIAENGGIINAVQIDWNGMVLGDKTINTTGEFASYTSTASEVAAYASAEVNKVKSDLTNNYALKSSIPTKVSQLANDNDYATTTQLATKQNTIGDLNTIRAGASAGATALQSVPDATNTTKGVVTVSNIYENNPSNSYIAFSTKGAHTLYTTLNQDINAIQAVLTYLNDRITALESYHATVPVTGITLDKTTLKLTGNNAGATLTATVTPDNATNKTVKWTSSNEDAATVSSGTIKAKGVGTAIITASATDGSGISAECTVTVINGSVSITGITPLTSTTYAGETQQLTVSYTDTRFGSESLSFSWTVYQEDTQGDRQYYNDLITSDSGKPIAIFTAPTDLSESSSSTLSTYFINVTSSTSSTAPQPATIIVKEYVKPVETKYYWYVGNENPKDTGMATNIDTSALTFELDKSNNLLQTATSYTDLVGNEFSFPNHFVIPTEWMDKIQIVNANNAPWAWGTTVIDPTNKYTWCWNSGTGTGTFKIVEK